MTISIRTYQSILRDGRIGTHIMSKGNQLSSIKIGGIYVVGVKLHHGWWIVADALTDEPNFEPRGPYSEIQCRTILRMHS